MANQFGIGLTQAGGMDHRTGAILFALRLGAPLAAAVAWGVVALLLRDADTTRDTAKATAARFVWLDAGHLDGAKASEVLAALFGTAADNVGPSSGPREVYPDRYRGLNGGP